jgi:hypothetical protein
MYAFEYLAWGDSPAIVERVAGIRWETNRHTDQFSHLKTGLTDIFELNGTMLFEERLVLVFCEFFRGDSGLGSFTLAASGLESLFGRQLDTMYFSEDSMDEIWDESLERFGEPFAEKWIPMMGRSRKWKHAGVEIRVGRVYLPIEMMVLSYLKKAWGDTSARKRGSL